MLWGRGLQGYDSLPGDTLGAQGKRIISFAFVTGLLVVNRVLKEDTVGHSKPCRTKDSGRL